MTVRHLGHTDNQDVRINNIDDKLTDKIKGIESAGLEHTVD